jgi:hypothetical protein
LKVRIGSRRSYWMREASTVMRSSWTRLPGVLDFPVASCFFKKTPGKIVQFALF